jgi:2-dehydropantoate 2-reductase
MKIAVMAAGGLGGYYGALLAKDGHDVTFIARGMHLTAIRQKGLTIKSAHGDLRVNPAQATENPAEVGAVDWVLFGVKTYDTETAARAMRPMIGRDTVVVTFQNGVETADQIGTIAGEEHVVVAPTQIVSNIVAPGVIEQKSPFRTTTIGEIGGQGLTPRVEQIVAAFKRTGIEVSGVADGRVPLWHKFVFIASIAGLASLARTTPYDLLQLPEARATLHAAMEEVDSAGRAMGIGMDADIVERQYQFALTLKPGVKPSMQLDMEQNKRLEIEALSGAVVRIGAARGQPVPVHRTIYTALKMEDERRKNLNRA